MIMHSSVFETCGKWYFCDDEWDEVYGPFLSEDAAIEAQKEYYLVKSQEENS